MGVDGVLLAIIRPGPLYRRQYKNKERPSNGLKSIANHERDARLSRLHAQKHKAAAAMVRRTNTGSRARWDPSAKTRQRCASVISPKTMPVVMRYGFMCVSSPLPTSFAWHSSDPDYLATPRPCAAGTFSTYLTSTNSVASPSEACFVVPSAANPDAS